MYGGEVPMRVANREENPKVIAFKDEGIKNCYEFRIEHEDHTLGNLLTQQLLTESNVLFAGYRIHHPLDDFIYLRVNVAEAAGDITNAQELVQHSIDTITSDIKELTSQFKKELAQHTSDVHRRGYGQ